MDPPSPHIAEPCLWFCLDSQAIIAGECYSMSTPLFLNILLPWEKGKKVKMKTEPLPLLSTQFNPRRTRSSANALTSLLTNTKAPN